MLELLDVTKAYDLPGGKGQLQVLKGINLKLERGRSLAVVGPSGSGKSTLLNIIGTLDRPTTGKVLLDGQDLGRLNTNALAALRNRRIGFVFQLHHLLPQCTVLENVLIPTLADGRGGNAGRARALELLARVGLQDRATYRPGQLSGGELQRAALVRALINSPELLLADEPTGSLDEQASDDIAELLLDLNRCEKVTLLVVTHSLKLAERTERVMELRNGLLNARCPQ